MSMDLLLNCCADRFCPLLCFGLFLVFLIGRVGNIVVAVHVVAAVLTGCSNSASGPVGR